MNSKCRSLITVYVFALLLIFLLGIGGNKIITAASISAPIKNPKVLIIDAGHGGEDGGATSCTGVLESRINLQIALRLRDLMHLLGCRTMLLRDTDEALHTEGDTIAARKVSDLKERVRRVNQTENAVLVSIHQNYFSDSRYAGSQVFYASTGESRTFAQLLQNTLQSTVQNNNNRQIKTAKGIYLMEHIQIPGVLVECGFLSNPQEEAKLLDAEYQKKLCCVIAACCSRFLHEDTALT